MKIALFSNVNKDGYHERTLDLASRILKFGCEVFMPDELSEYFSSEVPRGISFVTLEKICTVCDVAVVLGGDGTIMRTARVLSHSKIPMIGVNLGRVGYIAELEYGEISMLDKLLECKDVKEIEEKFAIDTRMMLSCRVYDKKKTVISGIAMNDVVISKGEISRMIDLELTNGEKAVSKYRADGIIFSTPTGSTAYAMSAGGPVVDPSIECISVIPVCPYCCPYNAPIIFSPNSKLNLKFFEHRDNSAYITFDGVESYKLSDGARVTIKKSEDSARFIRIKNMDFYKLLNVKLTDNNLMKV